VTASIIALHARAGNMPPAACCMHQTYQCHGMRAAASSGRRRLAATTCVNAQWRGALRRKSKQAKTSTPARYVGGSGAACVHHAIGHCNKTRQ